MRSRFNFSKRNSPSLLVFGRLASSLISLASAPIVARAIGPEGRGLTAAAIAAIAITPILLSLGVPLEIRRRSALGEGPQALRSARILVLASIAPSLLIAWALTCTIFNTVTRVESIVIFIAIGLTPISLSWICDTSVLVSIEKFFEVFLLQLCQPIIYLSLLIALWSSGNATVSTIILASTAGNIATFIMGLVLVKVSLRGPFLPLWRFIRSGTRFMGSSIAEIASSRLDQLLVLPLIGPFQAGIYSVAATVGLAPIALGQAIAASTYPAITRAEAKNRGPLIAQGLRAAVLWSLLAGALIVASAPLLIPIIFGENFEASISVLQVIAVGTFFSIIGYVASMFLAAQNRALAMTINQVAALSVALVGLFALAPPLGALGAAIASTVSFALLAILGIVSLKTTPGNLMLRKSDFGMSWQMLFGPKN